MNPALAAVAFAAGLSLGAGAGYYGATRLTQAGCRAQLATVRAEPATCMVFEGKEWNLDLTLKPDLGTQPKVKRAPRAGQKLAGTP